MVVRVQTEGGAPLGPAEIAENWTELKRLATTLVNPAVAWTAAIAVSTTMPVP